MKTKYLKLIGLFLLMAALSCQALTLINSTPAKDRYYIDADVFTHEGWFSHVSCYSPWNFGPGVTAVYRPDSHCSQSPNFNYKVSGYIEGGSNQVTCYANLHGTVTFTLAPNGGGLTCKATE